MDLLGPWHLLLIAGIFVVLFGAKRLPDAARSLGKSARILKTELKDMRDDDPAAVQPVSPIVVAEPAAAPVATPVVVTVPDLDRSNGAAPRRS